MAALEILFVVEITINRLNLLGSLKIFGITLRGVSTINICRTVFIITILLDCEHYIIASLIYRNTIYM